jgi:hypothetical protein
MRALSDRFSNYSLTFISRGAARYHKISTALPTIAGPFAAPLDSLQDWASWVASQNPDDAADASEVVTILQEPATPPGDQPIPQGFNSDVGARTSASTCVNGAGAILYDPFGVTLLTPPALRFMKFHEIGHFAMKHLRCGSDPLVSPNYTEKEADCWAVGELRKRGVVGRDAILQASAYIKSRNDPAQGAYESSAVRSRYLREGCGTPL